MWGHWLQHLRYMALCYIEGAKYVKGTLWVNTFPLLASLENVSLVTTQLFSSRLSKAAVILISCGGVKHANRLTERQPCQTWNPTYQKVYKYKDVFRDFEGCVALCIIFFKMWESSARFVQNPCWQFKSSATWQKITKPIPARVFSQ